MCRFLPVLAALIMLPAISAVHAEPVAVVTGDNYRPYADRSPPGGGLLSILVRKVFAGMGDEARIDFMPRKRGYRDMLSRDYVGSFPYCQSDGRDQEILYSAPLIAGHSVALVREDAAGRCPSLPLPIRGSAAPVGIQAISTTCRMPVMSASSNRPTSTNACA